MSQIEATMQFPGPIRVDNLKAGITYLRNPILCKIFREAHYIEKLGTGFITLFSSYKEQKLNPPQVIEGENYIKCILPRGKLIKQLSTPADDHSQILQLFNQKNKININDVISTLAISRAHAGRKLNELIKQGLIERIGRTKAAHYRLIKD